LDPIPAPRVRPFDVVEEVTDNATGATLDATFVRKKHAPILLRRVAVGGTAVDALLPFALKANVAIDNADVGASTINVIGVQRQF